MKILLLCVAVTAAWMGLTAARAKAQMPIDPQVTRPLFGLNNQSNLSPYLNLLRNRDPAANYYLGVVPEYQRRNFVNRTQGDFQDLFKQTAQNRDLLENSLFQQPLIRTLPPTGHATGFLNYGPYFSTLNRR